MPKGMKQGYHKLNNSCKIICARTKRFKLISFSTLAKPIFPHRVISRSVFEDVIHINILNRTRGNCLKVPCTITFEGYESKFPDILVGIRIACDSVEVAAVSCLIEHKLVNVKNCVLIASDLVTIFFQKQAISDFVTQIKLLLSQKKKPAHWRWGIVPAWKPASNSKNVDKGDGDEEAGAREAQDVGGKDEEAGAREAWDVGGEDEEAGAREAQDLSIPPSDPLFDSLYDSDADHSWNLPDGDLFYGGDDGDDGHSSDLGLRDDGHSSDLGLRQLYI